MEEEVKRILEIINNSDSEKRMLIITECVSQIGTIEWQNNIKDLIKRIENLSS